MAGIITVQSQSDQDDLNIINPPQEQFTMSKTQKSNKENKKKPTMTPKEKKAAKKSKKDSKDHIFIDTTR
jgi:hypothetical protein